jgi:peptidoglycan hydrolase-like protein with peptidoglycan-binding domain
VRRRQTAYGSLSGPRPDRVAAWAVVLGVFLILLAGATSRADTGGAKLAPAVTEPHLLGQRVLSPGVEGADVYSLQSILRAKGYLRFRPSGRFEPSTGEAVRMFQRRAGLLADGVVGPATRQALIGSMAVRTATWYGPGFYGRRTACGGRLRRTTPGVAHRRLACGTLVTLHANGRTATVRVIDRGPYVRGVAWDLTAATARALGLARTAAVRIAY